MEQSTEITIQEIFGVIWNKIILIIGCTLLGGLIAFCVSNFVLEPTYMSHISMYVNSNTEKENAIADINDINASQKLVSTYIEILKSDTVLKKVIEATGTSYTVGQLANNISANSVNGTEIFEVRVTTHDKEESALIANTLAELAPTEIIRVVQAGSVVLLDSAVPAVAPASPNTFVNTFIGLMAGGILAVAAVLVAAMLDKCIKNEEDLKRYYAIPILGTIPDLEDATKRVK